MKSKIPVRYATIAAAWVLLSTTIANASTQLVSEWFALGSGCRAKSNLPGNVRMEFLPQEKSKPDTYRYRFVIDQFELRESTYDASTLKFARECAIRLSVNPPEGKKLKNIVAETSVLSSKERGTAVNNLVALKVGAVVLSENLRTFKNDEKIAETQDRILLFPGKGSRESMPELKCAEPKIVGVDYSFIAERVEPIAHPLVVTLGSDRSAIVELTLSDC